MDFGFAAQRCLCLLWNLTRSIGLAAATGRELLCANTSGTQTLTLTFPPC